MRDIKDLCARIEDELSKIADNGLTTGNLEMTYKLIDMYKDIKTLSTGIRKQSITTLSLMRCVADTMTITANVEESVTAWGDTAQMMAE